MLRKKGDTYEIDRELTGKLAIESNAELQEKVEKLKKENRKLKEKLEQIKKQRIFSSKDYDLIILTSATPQYELRKK